MTTLPTVRTPENLLAALNGAGKAALLHQHSPGVEELGLAEFRTGTEAAHGVAWLGTATVFPQTVGLAATWDEDLLRRVGRAVGQEVRAKKAADPAVSLNVWAPVVNPLRHPLWGRNEEGFSEDPRLTGILAAAFCRGLRGDGEHWLTVPTLKHFLGYNNETDRNVSSTQLRLRVLHEYELPAYRIPVEDGNVGAVMLSYNLVNGRPAHVSDLVREHLRRWDNGEDLVVVTDAGAPTSLYTAEKYYPDAATAHAAAIRAGVDNFTDDGPDSTPTLTHLQQALERGLLSPADIDRSVLRLLRLRERTGEFSAAGDGGPLKAEFEEKPEGDAGGPDRRALAAEAAAKAVVLLRNEPRGDASATSAILPLGAKPGTIAVVGTLGSRVLTDWYSGTPEYTVSLGEALAERYPHVSVLEGNDTVALRSVRTGKYLGASSADEALTGSAAAPGEPERFDLKDWGNGDVTLRSTATGLLLTGAGGAYLYPSAERVGGWVVQESFRLHRAADATVAIQHAGTGKWVHLEAHTGSALLVAGLEADADRFVLRTVTAGIPAAAAAAAAADVVVVAVGNDPHLGGRETLDRSTLELSHSDQELVRAVSEANPRTVLAVISSYPYALGALADLPAILWSSHGGQELGHALAAVLSGDADPSGRLPQTWYAADSDLPDLLDYDIISSNATYQYSIAEPLYPFGHGLSYGCVHYDGISVAEATAGTGDGGDSFVGVDVTVSNDGDRPAWELVQLYVTAPGHPVEFPRLRLAGHARVLLQPGQQRTERISVSSAAFETYSLTAGRMLVEPCRYVLLAGSSAGHLPLQISVDVDGSGSPPRRFGDIVRAEAFDESSNLDLVPETRDAGTAVAPRDPSRPAWAVYRGWDEGGWDEGGREEGGREEGGREEGNPEERRPVAAEVYVVRSGGGRVELQLQGSGGQWIPAAHGGATAAVPAGACGAVELTLPGLATDGLRLVVRGPVTLSSFRAG
ncbi:glycoside hydrolase family 3 C-terminal domain-containing protein [Arthrobacter sp. Z1-15]